MAENHNAPDIPDFDEDIPLDLEEQENNIPNGGYGQQKPQPGPSNDSGQAGQGASGSSAPMPIPMPSDHVAPQPSIQIIAGGDAGYQAMSAPSGPGECVPDNGPTHHIPASLLYDDDDYDMADLEEESALVEASARSAVVCIRADDPHPYIGVMPPEVIPRRRQRQGMRHHQQVQPQGQRQRRLHGQPQGPLQVQPQGQHPPQVALDDDELRQPTPQAAILNNDLRMLEDDDDFEDHPHSDYVRDPFKNLFFY